VPNAEFIDFLSLSKAEHRIHKIHAVLRLFLKNVIKSFFRENNQTQNQ
jgi:hypothetical protein